MSVHKKILFSTILLASLLVIGCGDDSGQSIQEEQDAQAQIEALDVEHATHVELQLSDEISVDADVTPYETYADGIAAYYLNVYQESEGEYTSDDLDENPLLFGKSLEEQAAFLGEYMDISFNYDARETGQTTLRIYDSENNQLWVEWQLKEDVICTTWMMYPEELILSEEYEYAVWSESVSRDFSSCLPEDADEEIQTAVEEAKTFVTEFTGGIFSDYSLCFPLEEAGSDTWAFVFYYGIDGLPCLRQNISIKVDGDAVLSDVVAERSDNGVTGILPMTPVIVFWQDGKPVGIEAPRFAQTEGVYIEAQDVLGVDEILKKTRDYFNSVVLTSDIIISNIQLVYNTYYTDGSDGGEIQYTAYPFWCVQYYLEGTGNVCILFDAYTGDYITESMLEML